MKRLKTEFKGLENLPFDVLSEILLFIDDFNDIISFRLTCREFEIFCRSPDQYKGTDNAKIWLSGCYNCSDCRAVKNLVKQQEFGIINNIVISCTKFLDGGHLNKLNKVRKIKISEFCTGEQLVLHELLHGLIDFDAQFNDLIDDTIFSKIPNVRSLNISNSLNINGTGLKELKHVRLLNISGNEIIEPIHYFSYTKLTTLILEDCNIDDEYVEQLGNFKTLRSLDISVNWEVTGATFSSIKHIKNLDVSDCVNIAQGSLSCLTNLECLNIHGCPNLGDESLKGLKNLKMLILNTRNFTADGFKALKSLHVIEVISHSMFSPSVEKYLIKRDISLQYWGGCIIKIL